MSVHPLGIGDAGQIASGEMLLRFDARAPGAADARLRERLATLERLDREYGGTGPLALEGTEDMVAALLGELPALGDASLVLAVALWAVRHEVAMAPVEPVANALAELSNQARGREALAAVAGLMLGVIEHVRPALGADLERSNPERPWRILHANLAITAIRSEDGALMDTAFDALDRALPDERRGFYAEALALALAPGIAPTVRDRLEARLRKWALG